MAQYGLETETTVHLKGMQIGDSQPDTGGGKVLNLGAVIQPYDTIIPKPNFDGVSLYVCNASGRNDYSSGQCVIIVHEDIKKNFVSVNAPNGKLNAGYSDMASAKFAYALSMSGGIISAISNIILCPSLDSLDESVDPIYDYVNIRPLTLDIMAMNSLFYCQVTI